MPDFEFTITAEVTASARVRVTGFETIEEAHARALNRDFFSGQRFTVDEGNAIDSVYIPDPDDYVVHPAAGEAERILEAMGERLSAPLLLRTLWDHMEPRARLRLLSSLGLDALGEPVAEPEVEVHFTSVPLPVVRASGGDGPPGTFLQVSEELTDSAHRAMRLGDQWAIRERKLTVSARSRRVVLASGVEADAWVVEALPRGGPATFRWRGAVEANSEYDGKAVDVTGVIRYSCPEYGQDSVPMFYCLVDEREIHAFGDEIEGSPLVDAVLEELADVREQRARYERARKSA